MSIGGFLFPPIALTLLRLYGPVRVEIVLWIVPGFAQTFDAGGLVSATHSARPKRRRRTHHRRRRTRNGRRVHRTVVMMSPMMRRKSARSSEGEDSDRKNAFGHGQLL